MVLYQNGFWISYSSYFGYHFGPYHLNTTPVFEWYLNALLSSLIFRPPIKWPSENNTGHQVLCIFAGSLKTGPFNLFLVSIFFLLFLGRFLFRVRHFGLHYLLKPYFVLTFGKLICTFPHFCKFLHNCLKGFCTPAKDVKNVIIFFS